MSTIILASNVDAFRFLVLCTLSIVPIGLIIGFIWGVHERIKNKKNYENACENQHLMFNQLKKGDYMWRVYEDELKAYKILGIRYRFSNDKIYKIVFVIKGDNTWTHELDIDIANAKSYKNGLYYLLYKEAKLSADASKHNKNKEIANVSKVSPEEIKAEADKVIGRIEKIKEKAL